MVKLNKAMFTSTASVMALAMAGPAFAQTAPVTAQAAASQTSDAQADDVVVTGIRSSIQASLNAKRNNDMISEVISAEDIGKFPDKNVASGGFPPCSLSA